MPKPTKKRPIVCDEKIVKKTKLSLSDGRKPNERQVSTRKKGFPLWAQKLSNLHKTDEGYILGTACSLEDAYNVVDCHSRSLLCDYMKNHPNHGDGKKKNVDSRILWQSKQIQFDGVPFSVSTYYHFKCSYSVKPKTKAKILPVEDHSDDESSEYGDVNPPLVKSTKFSCCQAKVTMKEIVKYLDYAMPLNASKMQKKAKLKTLKDDLQNEQDMKTKSKFIVSLPLQSVHNHEFSGKTRSINRRVQKQIEQFVTGGLKSPKKVKDKLSSFVKEEFKGTCPPSKEDSAYYPTLKNIESYINTCNKDKSSEDEEGDCEISKAVESPEEQKPDAGIFCEPSTLEEAVKIFCSDLSDDFDTTDSCDIEGPDVNIGEKIRHKLEAIKRVTYSSTDEGMLLNVYNTLVILTDQFIPKNDASSVIAIIPNGHIPEMSVGNLMPEESFSTTHLSGQSEDGSATRSDLLMSSLPPNDAEGFRSESVQPVICSSSEDQIALLRQQILLDHDST